MKKQSLPSFGSILRLRLRFLELGMPEPKNPACWRQLACLLKNGYKSVIVRRNRKLYSIFVDQTGEFVQEEMAIIEID